MALIQNRLRLLKQTKFNEFKDLAEATRAYNELADTVSELLKILNDNASRAEIWGNELLVNSHGLLGG